MSLLLNEGGLRPLRSAKETWREEVGGVRPVIPREQDDDSCQADAGVSFSSLMIKCAIRIVKNGMVAIRIAARLALIFRSLKLINENGGTLPKSAAVAIKIGRACVSKYAETFAHSADSMLSRLKRASLFCSVRLSNDPHGANAHFCAANSTSILILTILEP
jgi:hypothetical protein